MNKLAGRQWINNQDNDIINSKVKKVPAIIDNICQRCGQVVIYRLPTGHKYCHSCIGLGRVSENDFLCRMSRVGDAVKNENHLLTWKGDLTDRQAKVSADLLHALQNNQDHLVHAVTGAGKTEMLFKAVEYFLQQGKYVALAHLDLMSLMNYILVCVEHLPILKLENIMEKWHKIPITNHLLFVLLTNF